MNYDLSFVVTTITATCYSWASSSVDHLLHVAPSTNRHSTLLLDICNKLLIDIV